jgi:pimeloyl-[acyl-carrier protein] synthase
MAAANVKDVDFTKVAELGNRLLEQLNALRDSAPIHWSERHQSWIVTGHAEVVEGFRGDLPLSVAGRLRRVFHVLPENERHRIPCLLDMVPRMLISLDPPEQLRLRKLMLKAFSKKIAEANRSFARDVVRQTLDAAAQMPELEFVEDVARQVSGNIILRLMGLPKHYLPKLQFWSNSLNSGLGGGGVNLDLLDKAEIAVKEMHGVFADEIRQRRRNPTDDFISSLITAEENGRTLTEEEIIATCVLTLAAGNDSTTNTIALGTVALARDAEARDYIRSHPEAIGDVMMEIMRYVAMSTSQVRVVTEDFNWRGHHLKRDDHVYLMIAGANRDPDVFPNPEAMDFTRPQDQNLTFGPGLHHCIGHLIAKMQLSEFFPALLERFESIELLDDPLQWGSALGFRGLLSLRVRLLPRQPYPQPLPEGIGPPAG